VRRNNSIIRSVEWKEISNIKGVEWRQLNTTQNIYYKDGAKERVCTRLCSLSQSLGLSAGRYTLPMWDVKNSFPPQHGIAMQVAFVVKPNLTVIYLPSHFNFKSCLRVLLIPVLILNLSRDIYGNTAQIQTLSLQPLASLPQSRILLSPFC
jgi:hypothetical protein